MVSSLRHLNGTAADNVLSRDIRDRPLTAGPRSCDEQWIDRIDIGHGSECRLFTPLPSRSFSPPATAGLGANPVGGGSAVRRRQFAESGRSRPDHMPPASPNGFG